MAIIDFGGVKEEVITRKEFPMSRARKVLKNETIAIIGYGVQGPAQSLNLRDNGFNVIIGQASSSSATGTARSRTAGCRARTLFEIDEAVRRGTIIQMLVSDAAQRAIWPVVKKNLKPGDALYFSHGFSIVYRNQTKVIPPKDVDVIMVAPKGSGTSVRRNFLSGAGINSSFAVEQDATGRAKERCLAVGIGIGSGYLFPTTFQHEVYSDLTGERGVLMGALAGIMEAQYDVLRAQRPHAERSVQRDGRGTHAEPHPPGGRERHGLDVLQLFGHGPARRAGLETEIQEGGPAGFQGTLPAGQDGQRDRPRAFGLRQAQLPDGVGKGTQDHGKLGDVAGGQGCPCLATKRSRSEDFQVH